MGESLSSESPYAEASAAFSLRLGDGVLLRSLRLSACAPMFRSLTAARNQICYFAFAIPRCSAIRSNNSRVRPAMEAGVSNHVWSLEEIVGLLD